MTELTLGYVDDETGTLLLNDEIDGISTDFDGGESVGCARELEVLIPPAETTSRPTARIAGYWHDDLKVGPGRRSVVQFQGCPLRCAGCYVPKTHDENGGVTVSIETLTDLLLDVEHRRDGVTILGGEPFAQPEALVTLILSLRLAEPSLHITVYSGFTLKAIMHMDYGETILGWIDLLIDGRYRQDKAHSATCGCSDEVRLWTGSCNQKVRRDPIMPANVFSLLTGQTNVL